MHLTRRECLSVMGGGALVIAAGSGKDLALAARSESKSERDPRAMTSAADLREQVRAAWKTLELSGPH